MSENKFEKYSDVEKCPIRNVVDRIGDKWSMLVLVLLNEGRVLRFNEIHKYIGTISQKMLSVTLKSLEADGLVARKVYPEVPLRVEYSLTQMGESLIPCLLCLVKWAKTHCVDIQQARERYAAR